MINVQICIGTSAKHIFDNSTCLTANEIWQRLEEITGLSKDHFYIVCNGRAVDENNGLLHGFATVVPKLLGGKGGFGSMLRAIGAQIEKTTNREACRDLSGRRLRDINEEKRLKAWIEKQSKREEEAAERKKRKLAKLCAEPKHEFKDQNYEKERSVLTERVGDAVEEGFKVVTAGSSNLKRKHEEEVKNQKKKKTLLDMDIDSDELDSSDDSDDEKASSSKSYKSDQQVSNDSGHSSDETEKSGSNFDEHKNADSDSKDSIIDTKDQISNAKKDKENIIDEIVKITSTDSKAVTDTTKKDEVVDTTDSGCSSEVKKEETIKIIAEENK